MKARIKETGELVDVEDLFDDGTALIADRGCMKVSKLKFLGNRIDWQSVRKDIAIEILRQIPYNAYNTNDRWINAVFYCSDLLTKKLMEEIE